MKMYAKTKELGPIGGRVPGTPPRSANVVAGEIKIILNSPNIEEVRCRLRLLQKNAHWKLQGLDYTK